MTINTHHQMSLATIKDYDNWYIVQTLTKREHHMKNMINNIFNNYFDILIPSKEFLHTKNGIFKKVICPLFPGYLFLYNEINTFIKELDSIKRYHYLKPVCFNNKPAKIRPEEMEYLQTITNEQGIVPLSHGIFHEGDTVKILEGPLKDCEGKIIFINKKKHKAKVHIKLFNHEINIVLGLNLFKQQAQ
ncbi:MAG: transcription termination/antitermination NusG family protein [bacterium]